jgi:hypothetical protein
MDSEKPLSVCAAANGGCDVDLKYALFVGGTKKPVVIETAADIHLEKKCVDLQGTKVDTPVALVVIAAVVPLKSDSFEITLDLDHPDLGSQTIKWPGQTGGGPKGYKRTFWLEQ